MVRLTGHFLLGPLALRVADGRWLEFAAVAGPGSGPEPCPRPTGRPCGAECSRGRPRMVRKIKSMMRSSSWLMSRVWLMVCVAS